MDKERVTINISKRVIRRLDYMVDHKSAKNRSHAVESILLNHFYDKLIQEAVFLMGGENISEEYGLPYALMPYQGKTIFEHKVELMKEYNIFNICVAGGSLNKKIKDLYGDGSKLGVKLTYIDEPEPLGSGGALLKARNYISGRFVLLNLTNYSYFDLGDVIDYHKRNKPLVTILVKSVGDPSKYGSIEIDGNTVVSFQEKSAQHKTYTINAGFYIIEPEIFRDIKAINKDYVSLEFDVFPKLAQEKSLIAYQLKDDWYSVRDPKFYEEMKKEPKKQ